MKYTKAQLKNVIDIESLVSVFYFEFAKDYIFEGEKHNFWEFVYVDKGEIEVMANTKGYKLKHGECIFHKPNEFHNLWANGKVAPNVLVISFLCYSPSINYFKDKIIQIDEIQKNLLSKILSESKKAFHYEPNEYNIISLKPNSKQLFGCEQLIKLYLEQFFIYTIRLGNNIDKTQKLSFSVKKRSDNDLIVKIIHFLEQNIYKNITFQDIIKLTYLSETHLKTIFKQYTSNSVMKYYRKLKIEEAKKLIRNGNLTFTEIAEKLQYNSIHYFSTQFKSITGMTPSEYAKSIRILI